MRSAATPGWANSSSQHVVRRTRKLAPDTLSTAASGSKIALTIRCKPLMANGLWLRARPGGYRDLADRGYNPAYEGSSCYRRKDPNMDAAILQQRPLSRSGSAMADVSDSRLVTADEFRDLLVSHRRMIRFDRRAEKLRGLQDLDTGEVFFTDERRLFDVRR
jgi:hypothetical protein